MGIAKIPVTMLVICAKGDKSILLMTNGLWASNPEAGAVYLAAIREQVQTLVSLGRVFVHRTMYPYAVLKRLFAVADIAIV